VWIDRSGNREPLGLEPGFYAFPRISPDGRKVALVVSEGGNSDIMVFDFESQVPTRLTFEPSTEVAPIWTPDGSRVVFTSNRDGAPNLYSRSADGVGDVERLTESPADQRPYAFAPDGALLFTQAGDVWMLAEVEGQPVRLTQGSFAELYPTLAPNGRFLAVQSNEFGPREVIVQSFPDLSGKLLVSTLDIAPVTSYVNADARDAWSPVWSKNGREIYYQSGVNTLVRIPVGIDGAFTHGNPEVLFEVQIRGPADGPHFDVTADGERFLVIETVPGGRNELIVVQNWQDVLRPPRGN
jgi:Tol biopolymer transport system component